MEPEFWHERWKEGRIGFHEGRPNAFLARHVDVLGPAPATVLVPLAGKAQDLIFLATKGHNVVGVELSPQAVQEFFAENGLQPTETAIGPYQVWSAGRITMLIGDFFALTSEHLASTPLSAFYDRAAIVALPPDLRARYAAQVRSVMPAGAPGLMVTFEYPQEIMDGPPFAVPAAELRRHYQGLALEEIDSAMADLPRLREVGGACVERCFTVRF